MRKGNDGTIRVVVIDDSPTAQDLLVALLQGEDGIDVVGRGCNGDEAVRLVGRLKPDLVTMDVSMPKMDGLQATRRIMEETPTRIVIVTASLMRDDMDLTFEALQAGALTAVRKPGLVDPETCTKLVRAVKLMARVPVVRRWDPKRKRPAVQVPVQLPDAVQLDHAEQKQVQIIGIASSTGGPGTLATVLKPLAADFPIPILVVQHVTDGFSIGLADWLNGETSLRVRIASHGEKPASGAVLMPPDDYHMQVNVRGEIELYKGKPYRGLRPSANYLFHSLARAYGHRAMGIILTGMGDDGVEGLTALHDAGGLTLAQNEESCVVYGMPREAVANGAVDRVLTPGEIALSISRLGQHIEEASDE